MLLRAVAIHDQIDIDWLLQGFFAWNDGQESWKSRLHFQVIELG